MTSDNEMENFKSRVYSRTDEQGNEVMGVKPSSNLTITRKRRCQNCIHFDTEEKARTVFDYCIERDKKVLKEKGCHEKGIRLHIAKLHRGIKDQFRNGVVGICLVKDKRTDEGADSDFTAFQHLCDQYSGRIVISASEAAADPLSAEVYDNLKKVDK